MGKLAPRCRFLHEYKESDVVEGRPASQIGLKKSSEKKLSDAKLKPGRLMEEMKKSVRLLKKKK